MLLCTKAVEFELPLGYFTINGDLFNLPAGPVSFAVGVEYRGERWKNDPASAETTFDAEVGSPNRSFTGEPGRLGNLSGSAISGDQPAVELPRRVQPRVRHCRARGMVQPKHFCGSAHPSLPFIPAQHSQYNAQKPKFSVRWQPLDPKWMGPLTLRGSYSEAFHAPTLPELTPAGIEGIGTFGPDGLHDPRGLTPRGTEVPILVSGNPNLKPEVAYEWTYGAVYSPKWIKGLTLSADYWHIDLRSIASFVDEQFIINFENSFPGLVIRDPTTGAITELINPN